MIMTTRELKCENRRNSTSCSYNQNGVCQNEDARTITWKTIYRIEKAFGFRLYKWQRNYLLGNRINRTKHRRNGNTFAYCLKLLLSEGEPIKFENHNERKYIDEWHGTSYITWFTCYLKEINDILVKNGFETRLKENK